MYKLCEYEKSSCVSALKNKCFIAFCHWRIVVRYNIQDYKYVKEMLSWIILNTLWHKRVQRNTSNFVVKMYGSDNKFNESVTPLFIVVYLATLEVKNITKGKVFLR